MSVFQQFKMDPNKETNGVPYFLAPNKDKSVPTFVLARASKTNKDYQKMLRERTAPYQRQIDLKTFDGEQAESIYMEVFIQTILKGWSNVQNEGGTDIPFTMETAKKLFEDLPDLYDELNLAANDASRYRVGVQEAEAKN
jgi:hypothetical protein